MINKNNIVTLTLNPSIDYVVRVDNFKILKTNKSKSELYKIGGKGINVSVLLSNLGMRTKALGFAGGFTGDEIIKGLERLNIDNSFVRVKGNSRINIKLKTDGITEINGRGAEVTKADISDLINRINENCGLIIMSGSIPKDVDETIYADIADKIRCPFILDCTGNAFKYGLEKSPLLVKPNIDELEAMFGTKIESYDKAIIYGRKLIDMGAENVIVSMGEKGAIFTDGREEYINVGIKGNVINTVGAGDSMVAGFVYGYQQGMDKESIFKFACACGTACAFCEDLPDKNQIMKIFKVIS